LIFNRPDTTSRVFEKIRAARPPRLYIAADGPRPTKPGEAELCQKTLAAAGPVDWPCDVQYLIREKNVGCKEAVSGALDWFFLHEEEGIILEDDCLPSPDFFRFCDTMLARYRHDERIRHIGGCNFQEGNQRGNGAYYYSHMTHVWGWAGWRRVWRSYDKELSGYTEDEIFSHIEKLFGDPVVAASWLEMAVSIKRKLVDTWDIQLTVKNLMLSGLSVMPNVNLISNIGFDSRATHTLAPDEQRSSLPTGNLGELTPPDTLEADLEADMFTMSTDFHLAARRRKYQRLKYRLKRLAARLGGPRRWKRAGT
jgi:hypothetical protein